MCKTMMLVIASGLLCGGCVGAPESAPEIDAPPRGTQDGGHGTNGTTSPAFINFKTSICQVSHFATIPGYTPGQPVDNSDTFLLNSSFENIVVQHPEQINALNHLMYWAIPAGRTINTSTLGWFTGSGGLGIQDTTDPNVTLSPQTRMAVLETMAATWNDKSVNVPFLLSGKLVAHDPLVNLTFDGATLHATDPKEDAGFIVEMGIEAHCTSANIWGFSGGAYYSEALFNEMVNRIPTVKTRTDAEKKIRDRFCLAGYGSECPIRVYAMKDYCVWATGAQYNNPASLLCSPTLSKIEVMATMIDPASVPLSY